MLFHDEQMNKMIAIAVIILVIGGAFLWHNSRVNYANDHICITRDNYHELWMAREDPITVGPAGVQASPEN